MCSYQFQEAHRQQVEFTKQVPGDQRARPCQERDSQQRTGGHAYKVDLNPRQRPSKRGKRESNDEIQTYERGRNSNSQFDDASRAHHDLLCCRPANCRMAGWSKIKAAGEGTNDGKVPANQEEQHDRKRREHTCKWS